MTTFSTTIKKAIPTSVAIRIREVAEQIEPWLYMGWSVQCPCCWAQFRAFLPHGRPVRKNALCPTCGSLERHRLMMLYLRQNTSLFTEKLRLLHFAPENTFRGIFSKLPTLQYVTTDYCEMSHVNMDITNLAVADNSFDAVICSHVLEHIPDDRRAMQEIHRVLKPGGWAILQVPLDLRLETTYEDFTITDPHQRKLHFGQEDHVRWYGRDYIDRLRSAGFSVQAESYVESLPTEIAKRHGLLPEDVYMCRKMAAGAKSA